MTAKQLLLRHRMCASDYVIVQQYFKTFSKNYVILDRLDNLDEISEKS